jgi:hypothetical protein
MKKYNTVWEEQQNDHVMDGRSCSLFSASSMPVCDRPVLGLDQSLICSFTEVKWIGLLN